ncbi:MAG: hypothetical protein ACYC7D_11195 [Nitrososphaerales archaeon]
MDLGATAAAADEPLVEQNKAVGVGVVEVVAVVLVVDAEVVDVVEVVGPELVVDVEVVDVVEVVDRAEVEVVGVDVVDPLFKFNAAYPPTAIMTIIITTTATMADLPTACFSLERLVESINQAEIL